LKRDHHLRLRPFLHRKSARQKIIPYLIAAGYSVPDLIKMNVPTLRALALPIDLVDLTDEVLEGRKNGPAFQYPGGKVIPHTAFYRLIRTAAKRATGKPMTQVQFRAWLRKT